jgi:hypothetical protein
MRVNGQGHAPAALPTGKRSNTRCTGGRVTLRAGLDGCGKSFPTEMRSTDSLVRIATTLSWPAFITPADTHTFSITLCDTIVWKECRDFAFETLRPTHRITKQTQMLQASNTVLFRLYILTDLFLGLNDILLLCSLRSIDW